jgi:hypothetical protein
MVFKSIAAIAAGAPLLLAASVASAGPRDEARSANSSYTGWVRHCAEYAPAAKGELFGKCIRWEHVPRTPHPDIR